MARTQTVFVCSACGGESPKWQGQCPACAEWNSLSRLSGVAMPSAQRQAGPAAVGQNLAGAAAGRFSLGLGELDRVVGGGMTGGSVCLLGGEPGIGKSTLLLQVAAAVSDARPVLYASGEESVAQTALRAQRLGLAPEKLGVVSASALEEILALATERQAQLLLIDSIQTMQSEAADGPPGSLPQLRECTATLVRFAKAGGTAIIIVGHVTKDGAIAGPKLLEHLVDTVLYFESDAASRFRILRATKNRFGAANELGFLAMSEGGLQEVKNPSAIFLSRHAEPVAGSVVMVARDGGRALLIEVQALVDHARATMPRRVAQGVDANRLSMLLAVMSRHAGVSLSDFDVFVNLVGGLQIGETATDLPLALALVSSLRNQALPMDLVVFGELGLTGEVRPVAHGEERVRELAKQGYRRVILPRQNMPRGAAPEGVQLLPVSSLAAAVEAALQA
jgi:DNA repair protein RadA/Sms